MKKHLFLFKGLFLSGTVLLCLSISLAACTQPTLPTGLPPTPLPVEPTSTPTQVAASPTATPTTIPPTPSATPISRVIGVGNSSKLILLRTLGKGYIIGSPVYSPDGRQLVIPASTGFHLYDAQTNQEIRVIQTKGYATNAAYSPDGMLLATNSTNGPISLWKVEDGSLVRELANGSGSDNYCWGLAFSADGEAIAAVCMPGDTVKVWRVADGQLFHSFKGYSFAFSPDSKMLVAWWWSSENDVNRYEVDLFTLADGSLLNQWEGQRAVFSPAGPLAVENKGIVRVMVIQKDLAMAPFNGSQAAFSADGQIMALYNNSQVMLYNVAKGAPLRVLQGRYGIVENLSFAPDGQTMAGMVYTSEPACCVGAPVTLAVWRVADGMLIKTFETPDATPRFDFAADGQTLAMVDSKGVQLLQAVDGAPLAALEGYISRVAGIAFSPDGQILASASGEPIYYLQLWRVADGEPFRRLENPGASGSITYANVAFTPDGQILAMGSDLYRLENGSRLAELENKMAETSSLIASSIAFSPDGKTLAAGYLGGQLHLWNLADNTLDRKLEWFSGEVASLSYSPDGQNLAAVYTFPDNVVQVWRVPGGEGRLILSGALFKRVAFSPDGQTLATLAASKENDESGNPWGVVQLWRASDGKAILPLNIQDATALAFSPDGQILATGSSDGAVRLWQVSDGRQLATLQGHTGFVTGLAFTPDGTRLASGSEDGTVILWGME